MHNNKNPHGHSLITDTSLKIKSYWSKGKKLAESQWDFFTTNVFEKFNINEFVIITLIIVVLNLYFLTNFSLSVDDEVWVNQSPAMWNIAIGRWTSAVLDHFLFPKPIVPFAPYLIFSLCLALSYLFLIRAHSVSKDYQKYLALAVFVAYPVWQFITGFDAILPSISAGIALATFSSLLFARTRRLWGENKAVFLIVSLSLQIILMAAANGAYQSFMILYLVICFGIMLIGVLQDQDSFKTILKSFFQVAIVLILAFVLSSIIARLAQWFAHIEPQAYVEDLLRSKFHLSDLQKIIRGFIKEVYLFYSGDKKKFGISFPASGLVIVLSFLTIVLKTWHENLLKKFLGIILWILVLVAPFILNLASTFVPTRSLFAMAYVMWLMSILLLTEKRKFLLVINSIFIFFMVLQSLNINGIYNARSFITQQYDRALATELFYRIGSLDENFDRTQPVSIDVYGRINFPSIYRDPWSGTMGVSFFDWDNGNLERMVHYMQLLGYENLNALPDERRLPLTPYYDDMPVWPAPGSVQKVGDVYMIKLGEEPDVVHAKFNASP
jgi:hypothetical protein